MKACLIRAVALALLALLAASVAHAVSAELKCQDGIAKSARNYFKSHFGAVSKCENKRANGSVPLTVECRPKVCVGGDRDGLGCGDDLDCPGGGACQTNGGLDADTGTALGNAATKLQAKIGGKCSDPLPSGVVLGQPCGTTGALTVAGLVDCIVNEAHGLNAERLLSTVYDDSGAITDDGVRKCQMTVAKESSKYAK